MRQANLACHPQQVAQDIAGAVHLPILSAEGRHFHPRIAVLTGRECQVLNHENTIPDLDHSLHALQTIDPIALNILYCVEKKVRRNVSQTPKMKVSHRFHIAVSFIILTVPTSSRTFRNSHSVVINDLFHLC
jgi:hypothetical protein